MRKILISILLAGFSLIGWGQSPTGYTEEAARRLMDTIQGTPFVRTTTPGAQWFPQAGFGLFIHWGIHCVTGTDPSWSMLSNVPWLNRANPVSPKRYYRLAEEFAPCAYDAEKWVLAAKEAGFQYVVITAKHHDGYCLWPTNYGRYNTRTCMGGRDLLRPLVEACHKYGLKIGFYFSPRDWSHPDYPLPYVDYDYANQRTGIPYEGDENQRRYDVFFEYTVGQLSELLTRYGQIDEIWFDGIAWPGVDTHDQELHAWIRALQPSIIINPRWETNTDERTFGDFHTEEIAWRKRMAEGRPYPYGDWWEFNETWSGHWGYSPGTPFRNFDDVIAALVYARSYGGNYLPDIGPQPDGRMRPAFYAECAKLAEWMSKHKESVIATTDFADWKSMSNVPLTRNEDIVYAHLLRGQTSEVRIRLDRRPVRIILLQDGRDVPFEYKKHELCVRLEKERRTQPDDVLKIIF